VENVKRIKVPNPTIFELEALKGYIRPIETEAELRLRIMEAAETIRNTSLECLKEFSNQSFLRCQSCFDVGGRNFWTLAL